MDPEFFKKLLYSTYKYAKNLDILSFEYDNYVLLDLKGLIDIFIAFNTIKTLKVFEILFYL